ncbi:MAG: hypothetical protein ACXABG_02745 [Promethearchaeota archaeon]|jgi:hypothetical protein
MSEKRFSITLYFSLLHRFKLQEYKNIECGVINATIGRIWVVFITHHS